MPADGADLQGFGIDQGYLPGTIHTLQGKGITTEIRQQQELQQLREIEKKGPQQLPPGAFQSDDPAVRAYARVFKQSAKMTEGLSPEWRWGAYFDVMRRMGQSITPEQAQLAEAVGQSDPGKIASKMEKGVKLRKALQIGSVLALPAGAGVGAAFAPAAGAAAGAGGGAAAGSAGGGLAGGVSAGLASAGTQAAIQAALRAMMGGGFDWRSTLGTLVGGAAGGAAGAGLAGAGAGQTLSGVGSNVAANVGRQAVTGQWDPYGIAAGGLTAGAGGGLREMGFSPTLSQVGQQAVGYGLRQLRSEGGF